MWCSTVGFIAMLTLSMLARAAGRRGPASGEGPYDWVSDA